MREEGAGHLPTSISKGLSQAAPRAHGPLVLGRLLTPVRQGVRCATKGPSPKILVLMV
jgi:hypothetical protein